MITHEQLSTILAVADPEGLLASGAPRDEYDPEASLIFQLLLPKKAEGIEVDEVADIVKQAWVRLLGPFSTEDLNMRQAMFRKVATDIAAVWKLG